MAADVAQKGGRESPSAFADAGDDLDEGAVACKACGDILEEGKAYELAGNRWHIECFRCHSCGTFLDSDANLLMLGDGSLICNNCTYSCSSCGDKIEELAILTGDQAFCSACFKCRNCKRKIDNLRYARTSQGIFCMECHESLMARRRKRTARNAAQRQKQQVNSSMHLDKSLPSLPPTAESRSRQDSATPSTDPYSESQNHSKRDLPNDSQNSTQDTLILPSSTYSNNKRPSNTSNKTDDAEEFLIPVAFDPTPPERPSPQPTPSEQSKTVQERPRDYFSRVPSSDSRPSHSPGENHIPVQEQHQPAPNQTRKHPDDSASTSATPDVTDKPTQQHTSQSDSHRGGDGDSFKSQDAPRPTDTGSRSDHAEKEPGSKPQSEKSADSPRPTYLSYPPKREDSLGNRRLHHNKENPGASKSPQRQTDASTATEHVTTGSKATESQPSNLPSDLPSDPPNPMAASHARDECNNTSTTQDPSQATHQRSTDSHHNRDVGESAKAAQSERKGSNQTEAPLHYGAGGGDFSMDEDISRIIGGVDGTPNQESLLRRVSNSVRNSKGFSAKGRRSSKDHKMPKSPSSGADFPTELNSPTASLADQRDELAWVRNELKRERQKVMEKDQKISELEASLNASVSIKQVNTELREKRSTMVFLDAQKEVMLRELEVLTQHIAEEKESGAPLDMQKLSNSVLRELAESIRGLKDSLTSQIEEAIQRRNELVEEIGELGKMKDKNFQEFEQLSLKNAQLAELNNQLVHQIQELYKANSGGTEGGRSASNGLGIYSHHKDKLSTTSVDGREGRRPPPDGSMSGTTAAPSEEAESATVVQGPQVVNIRKGQPRKFNWRNRGQHVAKGVTKGLKGAFSHQRDGQFAETSPYAPMSTHDSSSESKARSHQSHDPSRQGFGFFGHQKHKPPVPKAQPNGTPPASGDAPPGLFGTDLEQRLDIEKGVIPSVVTRCIEEVELRGMDMEGIYRKSGGSSQVQSVRDGFERSPDHDISDPDLDIHAVTSALKQYFRKLPTPLITYPVYDKLINACGVSPQSTRIDMMQRGLQELPRVHRDVLEFLVFHLKRVVDREKENLMTPTNIAVVFAPTILRPESLSREMTDVQKKNEAMQFLVENCQELFMGIEE